jgi:hypothetical protein
VTAIPDWLQEILAKPTCDVHEAGKALGLERHRAYAAVWSGHIPTIAVGARRKKVPTAWLRRTLGLDETLARPRMRRTK